MTDSADKDKRLTKWADPAMYVAEPSPAESGPSVTLLNMTPDPLGAIAAATLIYEGKVIRALADVTDEDRKRCLEQITKTRLQSPFEYVDMHFLIEGVTRSFTHQLVRQRVGASYSQESLRFAVKEDAASAVALPPWLAGTTGEWEEIEREVSERYASSYEDGSEAAELQERISRLSDAEQGRYGWDKAVNHAADAYQFLVDKGMPAEDARGLLPHSITTRIHYKTTLRGLLEHAGNRLCTQAQFEWKTVIALMIKAIREYFGSEYWQMKEIADMFRPICFMTGKCEFTASFDRPCRIKDRVDANASINRPSSDWNTVKDLGMPNAFNRVQVPWHNPENGRDFIPAIRPEEWLADPYAARERK